jgi:hypothetical protein
LYTVEELGGKRCTIDELLDMSPDCSEKDWATEGGSDELQTMHPLEAEASQEDLGMGSSSSVRDSHEARPQPLPAPSSQEESLKMASSPPSKEAALSARRDSGSMFVRRLPEEYLQLESVESALTARLRWTANFDFPGFTQMASASSDQKMEVQIRLPPHDNTEDSIVSMFVSATMRVEELLKEVINQHASRLGHNADSQRYELRLYDEDEEEPDYDFPPLDKGSEVGTLNVIDIALCEIRLTDNTPPSPPLSSPSEQVCELEDGAVTPGAVGGILQEASRTREDEKLQHKEDLLEQADVPRHDEAVCSVPYDLETETLHESVALTEHVCEPPRWRLGEREVPNSRPLRKVSDSEVVTRTVSGKAADELGTLKRSHRRCRSSPIQPFVVVGGFEQLEVPTGLSRRHGSAMELTALAGHLGGIPATRELRIILPDGALQCTIHNPLASSSTLVNGSMHTSEIETTSIEVPATSSTAGVCSTTSRKGDDNAIPESIVLTIRDDATLLEVLEQLATKCRQEHSGYRTYDPVNFAFERIDDGIRQRLDLDMQVKQLPPHSTSLTLVRKDAPIIFTPAADTLSLTPSNRQMDSLRRPLPSVFFFNEYTASIAAEYIVTVAARSSRARPCECQLVVDRERLYHQQRRCSPPPDGPNHRRSSFMSTLTKKLVKPWADGSRAEPSIFVARRVCDVQRISFDQTCHLGLCIVYSNGSEGGTVELVYQAQTPTECAEIVARVQFLQTLAKS